MPRYETLMPIRTKGSGPPLFCVHGQPLKVAQRMSPDRPVYGLSHVYHSDFLDEIPESIEQLAGQYLSEVRQVQPHGPYHFCGFSAGGMIAFEMARQLLADGETIGNLVLAEPTVMNRPLSWAGAVTATVLESDTLLNGIKQALIRAPNSIKARTVYYSQLLASKACFVLGRPLPESLRWLGYLKSLGPAMRSYEYTPINTKATLIYQMMEPEYVESATRYWNQYFLQGVTITVFPDAHRHEDFMLEPALSQTVALIDQIDA